MNVFTSNKFASAAATGTDWRGPARDVLEALESVRTEGAGFNLGFLYITDSLAADAGSILTLFRSVTQIEHWVGCVGAGVCATGQEYDDGPAISAMIGRFDSDDFHIFPAVDLDVEPAVSALDSWLDEKEPMLSLVHGDSGGDTDPVHTLAALEQVLGGFLAGGLSSSRTIQVQFAGGIVEKGVSGVVFSRDIPVATTISQGCSPVGSVHTITRCEDNILIELDGQRAFDVFAADLKAFAAECTGKDPDTVMLEDDCVAALFKAEVHVAFPVSGSDQRNYLVRDALGIDPDKGWIAVGQSVGHGDRMMFVHRNDETVRTDLSRSLLELRARVTKEQGVFDPKGAIYISCVARLDSDFGDGPGGELKLVREVIGDVPLTGFYASGEISNHRLYGYTGVLILFL